MGFRLRRPKLYQLLEIIKTRDMNFPLNTCVRTTVKKMGDVQPGHQEGEAETFPRT